MRRAVPGPPSDRCYGSIAAARPNRRRSASFVLVATRLARRAAGRAVVIDAAFQKIWILDAERGTLARASQLAGDQQIPACGCTTAFTHRSA